MHIEDLAVPSINMVRWGAPKRWLFVTPEQENVRAFEKKCRETFRWRTHARRPQRVAPHCSQFVRHANLLVTTEALRDWGIDSSETICREGELVVTLPGTYHQVVNMGENLAEAVNVMWGNCGEVASTYTCCSRDRCGHTGGISLEDLTPEVFRQKASETPHKLA
ncbi:set-domain histone methyltransferase-8 [Colletotrichum abscissum]|uniref:Set-domain histone methyltransferase-8 n=1 Tax=Colletotrichum abscissum TaxID=1671311 RepID=A0A9Q0ASX6_9PEZI|nr:set-domain histone methyltransferase-8 [Colletotrichum abscissum]